MANRFRLSLAQLNPVVGDIAGNAQKVRDAWAVAKADGADMVAFPEMFILGYQPQDLVMKPQVERDCASAIKALAEDCGDGPVIGIGAPWRDGGALYNCYFILANGSVSSRLLKHELPNETLFDEVRLYEPGPISGPYAVGPLRIGSPICEDAWHRDVAEAQAESGAQILVVPNGSPYYRGKFDRRLGLMVQRTVETGLPLVYLNMVGGQDDQVFDGASFVLNPGGALALSLPAFEETQVSVDFVETDDGWRAQTGPREVYPDEWEQDYRAMVLSLADYFRKTGFSKAVLGLSGGVDSALVATLAADALGPENVRCVMLPSEYTSDHSLEDAAGVANALGCRLDTVSIAGPRAAVTDALSPLFEGLAEDVTEENLQSRLRGLLLMACSNKFGEMLLTTGNKSEVAVGYATIYGDMSGGYNPLKDMYKIRVFETCRWRNANHRPWMLAPAGEVIPHRVIDKPPSAELREDQRDDDSLPPYEILDQILEALIDDEKSIAETVAMGFDRETVKKIERLIYTAEYKRFQSAPGTRLTPRAFWLDRRYPIANGYRDEG
ncbi:MAG: NAD+ synthase [Pseudomonadota bacterium]